MINPFLTKPNYIRIYGHRGARGDIVENSISGFKYTFDLGIKAVEFDVVISKDNIPTIFHDYRLNPDLVKDASGNWITDKSMKLVELTYEEISKYTIGSVKPETKYAKRFKDQKPITGEKIPKLTDFFKLVTEDKYKDVFLNLEIKSTPTQITKKNIYENSPWMVKNYPLEELFLLPNIIKSLEGHVWSVFYRDVTKQNVELAHKHGLATCVWTVNREKDIIRMIEYGVDGIITDYPKKVQEICKSKNISWF